MWPHRAGPAVILGEDRDSAMVASMQSSLLHNQPQGVATGFLWATRQRWSGRGCAATEGSRRLRQGVRGGWPRQHAVGDGMESAGWLRGHH
jgi:hypothetical protein